MKIHTQNDKCFESKMHIEDADLGVPDKGIIIEMAGGKTFYAGFYRRDKINKKLIYEVFWRISGNINDIARCSTLAFSLLEKGDIALGRCFNNTMGRASSILAHRIGFTTGVVSRTSKVIRYEVQYGWKR